MTSAPAAVERQEPEAAPLSQQSPRTATPHPAPRRARRPWRALRSVLFWTHLATGIVTGIVVLVMSATGTALAFQRQILDWSASRHMVAPPAGAERLPLDTLLARARTALPAGQSVSAVTVKPDLEAPVTLGLSARRYAYVDPYTGSLLPASQGVQSFFFQMERWHRAMGMGEGLRGKPGVTITGASNLAFLFLIVSGIFLWLPRQLSWRAFRAVLLLERRARGRRRDWNWHHVLGIWSAPVLFLLVLSGVFISYQWPTKFLESVLGEAPAAAASGGGAGAARPSPAPPASARGGGAAGGATGGRPAGGGGRASAAGSAVLAVSLDTLFALASSNVHGWESVQIRMPRSADAPISASVSTTTAVRPDRRTALSFDPESASMTVEPGYATLGTARRLRSWVRGVHTGEAAGAAGQAISALACLAGVLLVWTGVALAWRRFLRAIRPRRRASATSLA